MYRRSICCTNKTLRSAPVNLRGVIRGMAKRRAEEDAEGAYGLAEDPRPGAGGGGQGMRDDAIAAGGKDLKQTQTPHTPAARSVRARNRALTPARACAHPRAGWAAASAAVRGLAVQSQANALASLQQATDLDRLLAWGLGADPSAVGLSGRAAAWARARPHADA